MVHIRRKCSKFKKLKRKEGGREGKEKSKAKPGMMVHTYNSTTGEAEAGGP
jgi:hypothetical protein